jgi:hypothetical protein
MSIGLREAVNASRHMSLKEEMQHGASVIALDFVSDLKRPR